MSQPNTAPSRWALFVLMCLVAIVAMGIVAYQYPGMMQAAQIPGVAGIIVAIIAYLTIDRLRDMGARIEKADDRALSLWQSVLKEVQEVATRHVKSTIADMQGKLQESLASVAGRIDEMVSSNQWLKAVNPHEITFTTDSLEPIFHAAEEMINTGGRVEREIVRKWIAEAISNPNLRGSPDDYHNLGVLAAKDLNDDRLALCIYDKYLEGSADPNPDVLADVLKTSSRAEDFTRTDKIAQLIQENLDNGNLRFVRKWRPWVFLADHLAGQGKSQEAIDFLKRGLDAVTDPMDRPHLLGQLARTLYEAGQVQVAEQTFRQCVGEYPGHIPAILALARILWHEGRVDEARKLLSETIQRGNLLSSLDDSFKAARKMLRDLTPTDDESVKSAFLQGVSLTLGIAGDALGKESQERLTQAVHETLSKKSD